MLMATTQCPTIPGCSLWRVERVRPVDGRHAPSTTSRRPPTRLSRVIMANERRSSLPMAEERFPTLPPSFDAELSSLGRRRTRPVSSDGETALDFLPEEWLALFPAPTPPMLYFADDEEERPDDASHAADPLTPDSILRDFSGIGKVAIWPALRLRYTLPGSTIAWLSGITGIATVGLLGLAVNPAGSQFDAKDVALGITAAAVVSFFFAGLWALAAPGMGLNYLRKGLLEYSGAGALCRWLRLTRACEATVNPVAGALVQHKAGDGSCPCPSCCEQTQTTWGLLSLLDLVVNLLITYGCTVFQVYTPLVTYGPVIWSLWYGAFLGAVWTLGFVWYTDVAFPRPFQIRNIALSALERRLHCRAIKLASDDLLTQFRRAASDEAPLHRRIPGFTSGSITVLRPCASFVRCRIRHSSLACMRWWVLPS
ncbi:hypothetical protein DFJ74DRAFT_437119 [Hyaloraphidium curvatum]|nr:hypothetical protein DFJ74DRAFT_437119 [Hyaloraphidium curvatum]